MLKDWKDMFVLDVWVVVGCGSLAPPVPSPSPPAPLPPSGRGGFVLGGSRFWLVFGRCGREWWLR